MSIVSSSDIYSFLEISQSNYFIITSGNDRLILAYDGGSATNVEVADGTYSGDELATLLETAINTAFTITSTVSYDATTRKFTIAVLEEHTIAYTHTGSDGGMTFGFNQNHSAAETITSDIGAGNPTEIVDVFHNAVEDFAKSYCRRTFDSTSYTREKYDAKGIKYLHLKNYPVTALIKVSVGTANVIRIRNTYAYTSSSVSVSSTALTLTRDGSTDATLAFATYTTMTLLVAAVNAVGSGWYAELEDTKYASFKSTELIDKFGLSTYNSNDVDLKIPYEDAEYNFDVIADEGTIIFDRDIPAGTQNIFIDYTAGYSSDTMPDDLSLAVKIFVKYLYQRWKEETFGVSNFRLGEASADMEKLMPSQVKNIFLKYRRRFV